MSITASGTAYEIHALKDVNLKIEDGEFIGIIGHTGSGKSTLIQHLNGLVKATSGAFIIMDRIFTKKDFDMKALRSKVGLVFSIRSISCLRLPFLMMSVLDQRIRGLTKGRGRASGI